MPNPKANQQPLDLDRIKADAMSMGIPARALLDMIASGARSAVATTAGLPVDMVNTAVGLHNMAHDMRRNKFKGYETGTIPGGSEDIKGLIPNPVKDPNSNLNKMADFGGDFAIIPGVGTAAMKGAKMVGQEIADRVATGQKLMPGLFSEPQMAMHVVKPKGGNWLNNSVEKGLYPLTNNVLNEQGIRNLGERQGQEVVDRYMEGHKKDVALNNWVNKNLTNYVKKEMGTPEDPVRKLAEEGILHSPMEAGRYRVPENIKQARFNTGFPTEGMGQSDLAKAWEHLSDASIKPQTVEQLIDPRWQKEGNANANINMAERNKANNPWLEKLNPKDVVHETQHPFSGLGFDHILDVLKEDVASGRLRPESLKNVSMEQAVRRTYEYDQEMAKKMAEAQFKITEGMPVHKEYPEGYKWIELTTPKNMKLPEGYSVKPDPIRNQKTGAVDNNSYRLVDNEGKLVGWGQTENEAVSAGLGEKVLKDALKYEGDTMGHCVGGYCPDVLAGRSRIFSLRDAKGEPHVTIETKPTGFVFSDIRNAVGDERANEMLDRGLDLPAMAKEIGYMPANEKIVQIKGKGNARPVSKYDPFTQDFVKSGNWGEIGDLHNTGLLKVNKQYLTPEEADSIYKPKVEEANRFLDTHPAFEQHRQANDAFKNVRHSDLYSNDPNQYRSLERAAGEPLNASIPYTLGEMKSIINDPEGYIPAHQNNNKYEVLEGILPHIEELRQIHGDVPQIKHSEDQISVVPKNIDPNPEEYAKGGIVKHKIHVDDDLDMMRHELNRG